MKRALLPNLTFEYEISGRQPPRPAQRQCARWSHILRLIPGFEDAEPIDAPAPDLDAIAVWGTSERARSIAGPLARGWPPADVVRDANDKRVSHRLEVDLGVVIEGARIVQTLDDVRRAARSTRRWLVKHPFGVSGRERVEGEGALQPRAQRAVEKLFGSADSLVFEPHVVVEREWSMHYDVGEDATVHRRGVTRLMTDRHGVFRGNIAPVADLPDSFLAVGDTVARRLARQGYAGPIGIDCFRGTFNDREIERPLMEINARMSFGRLALELAERIGATLAWHHPARPDGGSLEPWTDGASRSGRWRLPEGCDPGGASETWIEILSDPNFAR